MAWKDIVEGLYGRNIWKDYVEGLYGTVIWKVPPPSPVLVGTPPYTIFCLVPSPTGGAGAAAAAADNRWTRRRREGRSRGGATGGSVVGSSRAVSANKPVLAKKGLMQRGAAAISGAFTTGAVVTDGAANATTDRTDGGSKVGFAGEAGGGVGGEGGTSEAGGGTKATEVEMADFSVFDPDLVESGLHPTGNPDKAVSSQAAEGSGGDDAGTMAEGSTARGGGIAHGSAGEGVGVGGLRLGFGVEGGVEAGGLTRVAAVEEPWQSIYLWSLLFVKTTSDRRLFDARAVALFEVCTVTGDRRVLR